MKLYTIILLSMIPFVTFAQTTMEEYDYLTVDYPNQIAKNEVPEKDGYYFQDLMNMVDNSGKVRLLYKDDQISVIPTATVIHVNGDEKVHFICVPHDESERAIFNKYADDLQQVFESDEVARSNYSKIMFRYPKQIQKFYDEITALEKSFAINPSRTTTPVETEIEKREETVMTAPSKPEVMETETMTKGKVDVEPETVVVEKVKKEEPVRSVEIEKPRLEEAPKVEAQPKLKVVLTEIEKPNATSSTTTSVNGISTAKVRSALAYRQLINRPDIVNETDKYGVVRIDVCVNNKGRVISTKYNKSDSDTKDGQLIAISEKLAKKYIFEKSHLTRQCGHIIFKYQFQ